MDLYLFDFDDTLYAFDHGKRLPALSHVTGVSQYRLANLWWAGGYERAAENGTYPSAEAYLNAFSDVTGARLTLTQWQWCREQAMSRIAGAVAALERAASLGIVSLLSNNPVPFRDSLPVLAPDVAKILGNNNLLSADLGARKPEARAYVRALEHYGVLATNAFFADDSPSNVAGAKRLGMTTFHFTTVNGVSDTIGLARAIDEFAHRNT